MPFVYDAKKEGWRTPFDIERLRALRPGTQLVDAKTGKVVASAETKVTPRLARKLVEEGLKELLMSDDDLAGRYVAEDIINAETGVVIAEAGDEITATTLKALKEQGVGKIPTLDIDHITIGPYIRNTMAVDKNVTREHALIDIYRVMRPGEPPTIDTAETLFGGLFFDSERYDLSAVGRVKLNARLDFKDVEDTVRVLRTEDILAVVKTLVELKDGRGEIDDIDHLGNRRVRSVGELMENQYRIGLLRMERAIRERMSSVDIDTVMPHDLINAQPGAAAVRKFSARPALEFMDQTTRSADPHKRRFRRSGRAPDPRRAGFRCRRAPTITPDLPMKAGSPTLPDKSWELAR